MRTSRPTTTPHRCPKCKAAWPNFRACAECKDTRKRCAACRRCSKCGTIKKATPAERWHVFFQDARGTRRRLPGFSDRGASDKLGQRCERLAAAVAGGDLARPLFAASRCNLTKSVPVSGQAVS